MSQLKVVNEVHISLVCCLLFAMQKQLNGLSMFIWGNLKLQKAVLICMKTASSNLWTNSAVMMVYLAITNRCLNLWTMPYFSWYWCRFIRHWRVRLFTFSKSQWSFVHISVRLKCKPKSFICNNALLRLFFRWKATPKPSRPRNNERIPTQSSELVIMFKLFREYIQ